MDCKKIIWFFGEILQLFAYNFKTWSMMTGFYALYEKEQLLAGV